MEPSQLQLHKYFVPEFSMKSRKEYEPAKATEMRWDEFSVDTDVHDISDADQEDFYQITLKILLQPAPETNFPYELRLTLVGFLECLNPDLEGDRKARLIRINGGSMLYGIAREVIRINNGINNE